MRGHEALIAMRCNGVHPKNVWIMDGLHLHDWAQFGEPPTVTIEGDAVGATDLRFVVGLTVFVFEADDDRCRSIIQRCKDHGAKIVIGISGNKPNFNHYFFARP